MVSISLWWVILEYLRILWAKYMEQDSQAQVTGDRVSCAATDGDRQLVFSSAGFSMA